jgi:hypothetical protein
LYAFGAIEFFPRHVVACCRARRASIPSQELRHVHSYIQMEAARSSFQAAANLGATGQDCNGEAILLLLREATHYVITSMIRSWIYTLQTIFFRAPGFTIIFIVCFQQIRPQSFGVFLK